MSRPPGNDGNKVRKHDATADSLELRNMNDPSSSSYPESHEPLYKLDKRRFIGLAQLVLLNVIVSWDWLTFAAVSGTSASFFGVTESDINWLSTGFLFAFVAVAPLVIWTLNRSGTKASILVSSGLILVGNWIRYAGTRASPPRYGVVVFGQVLIGFAQPFVLAAPTRYSNTWFSDTGRVSATAVATLANPLGGALGQLIGPLWATTEQAIPHMVLYTAILSTVATLPAPFIPKAPPTPPSAIAAAEKLDIGQALRELPRNRSFWLIFFPFAVYCGFFNAISSLLNQIMSPYDFTEDDAGITGALLIVVGLVAAGITSPIIDRKETHLIAIKILVPIIALGYLIFIFMPATRSVAGPYVVAAILGASSFSLLPATLEYLVLVTHPVSPEITSTICWTFGQLFGAIFIIIMNALKGGRDSSPEGNMTRSLVFQAVVAILVVPLPMFLGYTRFGTVGTQVSAIRLGSSGG